MSTHFRPRYSVRYSGRYCVNFGYARDRGKRVEGRGKRVEVKTLTRLGMASRVSNARDWRNAMPMIEVKP